jgi:hypothetical protein
VARSTVVSQGLYLVVSRHMQSRMLCFTSAHVECLKHDAMLDATTDAQRTTGSTRSQTGPGGGGC